MVLLAKAIVWLNKWFKTIAVVVSTILLVVCCPALAGAVVLMGILGLLVVGCSALMIWALIFFIDRYEYVMWWAHKTIRVDRSKI